MNDSIKTAAGKIKNKSVYRLVRFGVQLLIFLVLVVISTFLLRPLQVGMRARMTGLRDELLSQAELFLDRRIEYAAMGPSIFGALDIRNVKVYGSDTEPVITIERFRVAYSFWDLIRGRIPGAIRSVLIDRPVITLDLERDADLRNRFAPGPGISGGEDGFDLRNDTVLKIASLIPKDLLLRVRGGEFRILVAGNTISAEGLNFNTLAEAGRFLVSGKWSARAELAGFFSQNLQASMSGRIDGELSRDLKNGSINFRIPTFSGDFFVFRALTVNLTLTEKEIEIRKINNPLPFDFSLNYAFDTHLVGLNLRAEDFVLGDLITLTGPWRKYNPYLGVRNSGFAAITHSPQGDTSYEVDLSGSLDLSDTAESISYAVAGKGDKKYVGFTRCDLNFPRGTFAYTGGFGLEPFAPNGIFHVKDFSLTGDGGITGDFTISTSGRMMNLFGETVTLGPVEFSALDGGVVREDGGFSFSFSALRFRNIESYEDVQLATLSLEGSYDRDPRHLQGSLALDSFSVSDMLDIIRPFTDISTGLDMVKYVTDNVSITTEIFVTTDFRHVLYNTPRLVAAYSGKQDVLALVSVSGTDRRFELSEGWVVWAEERAEAAGYADFSNIDDIAFSFQTSYKDMFYFLDGEFLDRRSLSIRGSYGFQIYIAATDYGGYSGYMEASSIPIPLQDQFARLSLLVSLRYDSADYWSVTVDQFEVQDLVTPVSAITFLDFSGEINQSGLRFRRILFDNGQGPLTGRATASWGSGFSNPVGELVIRNQWGAEIVRIDGSSRGEAVDINFTGTDVQLGRFLRSAHNAVLSGNVEVHWRSLNSYSVNATLNGFSARIGGSDITVTGSAVVDQDTISLNNFRLRYNNLEGELDLLRLDRRNSSATAAARVQGDFTGRNLDMAFITELNFTSVRSWFNLRDAMNTFDGVLSIQNISLDTIRAQQPFNFVFSRNRTQMSLSGGPGDMLRLHVSDNKVFYAAFSNPAPFRGSVVGTISGNTIDAQTSDLYVDLASLWRFIPKKDVINVPGGFAEVSMEIRGSLGDPEFFGTARANSLRLSVPQYLRADIEPVPATITLEGNEMHFGPIPARVGSGAGMATGSFRFDRWVPNIFTLDIQVPDETPIPFGVDIAGIMAEGDASGHLILSMEDMVLRVSGDLVGNNAEINLKRQEGSDLFAMDTQRAFLRPQESSETRRIPTVADLRITTGPKVEFVYPSRDFPVIRANVDAGTGLGITADTQSGRFTVEGDVDIRSGEIFYFQRSFYIKEGILSFKESDIRFDPQISARAETRDRTAEGAVTVSMIVDSSPLISFTPRFESNPPLSQFEILSLLGQNVTGASSSEDSNESIREMVMAGGDFLTQFYAVRRVERAIRDFIHMDMFSIRTQALQNVLFLATGLQEPVDRIGVGNYFDNTTVFLGKYFGPDIFGQAMFSFRYDENRTTFGEISQDGFTLGAGLSLEANLGLEINGPLFDIQFNIAPRYMDPRIVEGISLTLLWKRSIRNFSDLWKEP